jgi:hypothetical protein
MYLSRVSIELGRVVDAGDSGPNAVRLLNRWLAGYGAVLAILLLAVWDMVFKPGL